MFKHIFKLFFRDLLRNRIFTLINLVSLSIALASTFLITLFVIHELSFDRFHANCENICRLNTKFSSSEVSRGTNIFLAEDLVENYPEVRAVTRTRNFNSSGELSLVKNNQQFKINDFLLVDQDFFNIFSIEIVKGKKNDPLTNINSVVISERIAKKYFLKENPVGETISIKNIGESIDFQIVGVYKNIPSNSTIQADFIGNIELIAPDYEAKDPYYLIFRTYALLTENVNLVDFTEKLNKDAKAKELDFPMTYDVQNLCKIYLGSDHIKGNTSTKSKRNILLFSVIAILILVVAGINYVIISTAKGMSRSTEVGIRKVVGASRKLIIKQIQVESILFILLILPFALMISELLLPVVNNLLGKQMEIHYFENYPYLIGLIIITILIGSLSGTYISLILSKPSPENILKRKYTKKYRSNLFRKGLMLIQIFVIAVLLIFIGVIFSQSDYIQRKGLGFNPNNLILATIPGAPEVTSYGAFVNSIKSNPVINSVSEVESGFFTDSRNVWGIENPLKPKSGLQFDMIVADNQFIETVEFEIVKGRNFNKELASDNSALILNETGAKAMGCEDSIGTYLNAFDKELKLIGIVKDFNFGSLHQEVTPIMIVSQIEYEVDQVVVRYNDEANIAELKMFLKNKWEEFGNGGIIEFSFMDENIKHQYNDDIKFGGTIKFFVVLTMIVAFLGLFGFSLYTSKQRNKEMGIRKVFGAKISDILISFSKEYLILAIIANVISWPVAYKLTQNWLNNFAFKIDYPFYIFAIVAIISILFVLLIVSINTIRVANQNPTDILRYE